jgi:hypothetical protein
VLDALLSPDFPGGEALRAEAEHVEVVGGCGCGGPSTDFRKQPGVGLHIHVNAAIAGGSYDSLFLFTIEDRLGGIEYVGNSGETVAISVTVVSARLEQQVGQPSEPEQGGRHGLSAWPFGPNAWSVGQFCRHSMGIRIRSDSMGPSHFTCASGVQVRPIQ